VPGWRDASVDERFLQIQIAFVVARLREGFEDAPQQAGAHALLKSPAAGLIRRIAIREHGAVLFPGAPSAVFPARERGQEGADEGPMLVGEVTGMRQGKKGPSRQNALCPPCSQRSFSSH